MLYAAVMVGQLEHLPGQVLRPGEGDPESCAVTEVSEPAALHVLATSEVNGRAIHFVRHQAKPREDVSVFVCADQLIDGLECRIWQ